MIDLTPLDVRKKRGDFRRVLRGYDPEEVDTFLDLVAERFEELVRANLILTERSESLESQVHSLEGRESAVQEALVSAQKLREETNHQSRRDAEILRDQATREVQILRSKAEQEISRQIGEAEALIRERQKALEDLERSRLKFLKSFRGLLEREMDSVEVEEARKTLEDTPLELNLRGWMSGAGEEEDGSAPGGFNPRVLDGVAPAGLSTPPEEESPAEAEDETPSAPTSDSYDELSAIDVAELAPSRMGSDEPSADQDREENEMEEGGSSSSPEEPKWLFSLLKKEEG